MVDDPSVIVPRPYCDLSPSPVSWLWPDRFALGRLALLDGDPSLGKSLLALDLCARLSTGRAWHGGGLGASVHNSLFINGEDAGADCTLPRLIALGADVRRVFYLDRQDQTAFLLRLPHDTDALEQALDRIKPALVVIDPIMAFLATNTFDDVAVRQALTPLAQLARRYACLILLVRHLNKIASHRALYRGCGSIGFQGICRSSWLLAANPLNPAQRVLANVKNNDAPLQPSLILQLHHPEAEGQRLRLEWLGEHPWSADQLLRAAMRPPRVSVQVERAKAFLTEFLKDGPRSAREISPAGREQNLGETVLRRARNCLKIKLRRLWAGGLRLSYWMLPGQELPPDIAALHPDMDLKPVFELLEKQYPPRTRLDDM